MFHSVDPKSLTDRAMHTYASTYTKRQFLSNPSMGQFVKGIRGEQFLTFIKNILETYGKLTSHETSEIFKSQENIKLFEMCFVHPSFDDKNNYELFEHFGDKIVDYSISKYIFDKFPKLSSGGDNPKVALKIVSKLHLYLRSKDFLSIAGKTLGFQTYISANSIFLEKHNIVSVYEDIFEAFMSVCDRVINKMTSEDVGYIICYEILKSVYNSLTISIKYQDVFDSITILKEYCSKSGCIEPKYIQSDAIPQYSCKIVFDVTTPDGQTYKTETPIISEKNREICECKIYKLFYNMIQKINGYGIISNVNLEQVSDPTLIGLRGDPTQVIILLKLTIVNAKTDTYETLTYTGSGYDEKSAKKNVATQAINHLMDLYNKNNTNPSYHKYNVYKVVDAWNEDDWI